MSTPSWKRWIPGGVLIMLALSVAAGYNLFMAQKMAMNTESPAGLPVLATVEGDVEGVDQAGNPVRFSSLKGKVFACAYLYTKCPHGCAMVFGGMKELLAEFRHAPDFHLASVAVVPDLDTPEIVRGFAEAQGVHPGDPWTFLLGSSRQPVWDFMEKQLKLQPTRETPPAERLSECDVCDHDLRVVLIDREGRIRGYYSVMHPIEEVRAKALTGLRRDTRALLESPSGT